MSLRDHTGIASLIMPLFPGVSLIPEHINIEDRCMVSMGQVLVLSKHHVR